MNTNQLVNCLLELRSSSVLIQSFKSDDEIKFIMNKYDMLFLGGKFNIINSIELLHCLKNYFGIEINNEKLNELIPIACESLKMNIKPIAKVNDLSNPESYGYIIELW